MLADAAQDLLTGDFLSMGLIMNFLSLKEMFLISLQGKPIFGVNLEKKQEKAKSGYQFHLFPLMRISRIEVGCRMFYNIQPADGALYKQTTLQEIMRLNTLSGYVTILNLFVLVKNGDRNDKKAD